MAVNETDGKRWVGFEASNGGIIVVDFLVPTKGPFEVQLDTTWPIPSGDSSAAYFSVFKRVQDYLRDHGIDEVAVIGSAVSGNAANLGLLHGAEVRGVVIAAAGSVIENVHVIQRGTLSRKSSRGKVSEYTKDEEFWKRKVTGKLRVGSRSAAYLVIAKARESD